MRCLLLALRTDLMAEDIRQTLIAAEPSLADSRVLGSFTRVDPDDAAAALYP
jgi:ferric-dicitrate binding protein FerR (iron transport regulator)